MLTWTWIEVYCFAGMINIVPTYWETLDHKQPVLILIIYLGIVCSQSIEMLLTIIWAIWSWQTTYYLGLVDLGSMIEVSAQMKLISLIYLSIRGHIKSPLLFIRLSHWLFLLKSIKYYIWIWWKLVIHWKLVVNLILKFLVWSIFLTGHDHTL